MTTAPTVSIATPTVSARRLAALLWSRRLTLAAFVAVAALASALYALTRQVEFESNALLAQAREENSQLGGALSSVVGQIGGLVSGLGGFSMQGTSVEESAAVLRSREFALRFMRKHGVLQFLFPRMWDPVNARWKYSATANAPSMWTRLAAWLAPGTATALPPAPPGPSDDQAVKAFDEVRKVEIDRRTNFVRLSVRGPTPQVTQEWATAMIAELNEALRDQSLDDSRRAVAVLSKRLEAEQLQTVRVIGSALLESQLRREVAAESRREFALRVLDPPSLPDQRVYPRRTRMVLIGAIFGWLLGAAYVIGITAWRQRGRPHRDSSRTASGRSTV